MSALPEAQEYVKTLNREHFAEFDDWRMPAIPELMSLIRPEEKNGDLCIDQIFDSEQTDCWSSDLLPDTGSEGEVWIGRFDLGDVISFPLSNYSYVRAGRSRQ